MLAALLLGLSVCVPARSQGVAPDSARTIPYGVSIGLRAIQAETILLQLVREDTVRTTPSGDAFLGIGQLVVDETLSRTGSYFYDVFYRLWRPPADARFVSVTLAEQPIPGQGTLVSVRLDGELVFQSRLSPREEDAEALAQQAVAYTLRRLPRGDG